jgi:gas vesicle protein
MRNLSSTAGHATEQLKETFVDLSAQAMKLFNNLREAEDRGMETVLERLGLQRRQSALTPALWFAGGAVVAGAAVLLLAPTSGKKLRQRIATILDGEVQELTSQASSLEQRLEETLKSEASTSIKTPNGATHDVGR